MWAVRAGDREGGSGTTVTGEHGDVVAPGDPAAQTRRALWNVESALEEAGAAPADAVRVRVFPVDIEDPEAVGEAHHECFGDVRPATSVAEVARPIDDDLVLEIEADAVVG